MNKHNSATWFKHLLSRIFDDDFLRSNLDLIFVFLWTFVTLLLVFVPPLADSVARLVASLVFVLAVPSYTLVAAIFPQRNSITSFERSMLVLGLGFPVISLVCLGLNFSSWGITLSSIAASATIFIVFCSVAALTRRRSLPPEQRFFVGFWQLPHLKEAIFTRSDGQLDKALSVILVLCIVVAASALTIAIALPKQGEQFTEFYLLGSGGVAYNYPINYTLGEQKPITVGIINHEYNTQTYDLVIKLNDSARSTTLYTEQVTLANNQTLEKQILIKPDRAGNNMKLEFYLYQDNNSILYREDHLWITVTH